MSLIGKCANTVRLPMSPTSDKAQVAVREAMVHAGLIDQARRAKVFEFRLHTGGIMLKEFKKFALRGNVGLISPSA